MANQFGAPAAVAPAGGALRPSCGGMRARVHAGHSVTASSDRIVIRDVNCNEVVAFEGDATRSGGVEFSFDDASLAVAEASGLRIYAVSWTPPSLTPGLLYALHPRANVGGGAWHPSGASYVFSQAQLTDTGVDLGDDLMSLDLSSGAVVALTNSPNVHETAPEYSPDGSKLAYTRPTRNRADVWVRSAGGDRQLTNKTNANVVHALMPSWSPDGASIAFTGMRQNLTGYDIWRISSSGTGKAKNLTNAAGGGSYLAPQWR